MVQAVAAGRSPWRQTKSVELSSALDEVPMGQVSLRVRGDSPVSIFLPTLCTLYTLTCVTHAISAWQQTASVNNTFRKQVFRTAGKKRTMEKDSDHTCPSMMK